MKTLDHHLKPQKSNKILIRVIIYSAIVIVIIIAWFLLASKVKSIQITQLQDVDKYQKDIEEKYQERLANSDKDAYDLAMIGKTLVDKNHINLGLLALLEAMKKDDHYRDIYLYTSKVYFDLGEFDKALEILQKTQDIDPLYPETQLLMAKTYEELGDVENAKLCYDKYKDFSKD